MSVSCFRASVASCAGLTLVNPSYVRAALLPQRVGESNQTSNRESSTQSAPPEAAVDRTAQPTTSGPDAQGVYEVRGDVQAPVVIHAVNPKSSSQGGNAFFTGSVWVSFTVSEKGVPQDLRTKSSDNLNFDQVALDAVRKYKFRPAMKGNKPVPVHLLIEIKYQVY